MLNNSLRVVFIGAHPDDIEMGCAGTILKYTEWKKTFILMTCGGDSSDNLRLVRREEQLAAANCLGVEDVRFLDFEDGKVCCDEPSVSELKHILRELSPDLIFTHSANDSHRDHRETHRITAEATRNTNNLIYYKSYSSIQFEANLFVDVSAHIDQKEAVLRLHQSQMDKYNKKKLRMLDTIMLEETAMGYRLKTGAVESFSVAHIIL